MYRTQQVWWPVLRMSSWVQALCQEAPGMILAGHRLEDTVGWQSTFSDFWMKYKSFCPSHPIFTSSYDLRLVVPYYFHGDEGRGQCRRQFMVESFQPCISWKGSAFTNESGYPALHSILLFCITTTLASGETMFVVPHRACEAEAFDDNQILIDLHFFLSFP